MDFCVIGELINTSRAEVRLAVEQRDAGFIEGLARKQQAGGARYLDINAGARPDHELDDLGWLMEVVQQCVSLPLCLDSSDPEVLRAALRQVKRPPLINSINLDPQRYEPLLDLLRGKECGIIALCMDGTGLPQEATAIVRHAQRLVEGLESAGLRRTRIYVDPLARPVATDTGHVALALEAVEGIREALEGVHIVCGLSNVSFGLPHRRIINRVFLSLMMQKGLDSALLDPLDQELMACLTTTQMLLGHDSYCLAFMEAAGAGKIPA